MGQDPVRTAQERFREVHRLHRRVVERSVGQTGVFRSQHMTLMFLSGHEGCSQKEIAEAHQISYAAVAVNLKKLEKLGLVERIIDSADNRCNRISITDKGRAVVAQSRSIFESIDSRMFSGLSPEDLTVFIACLEKVRNQLSTMEQELEQQEKP